MDSDSLGAHSVELTTRAGYRIASGFLRALPQLLLKAGIENFFTIKLTWSETNDFPYDLFWWEGLDGSRVLAHMFDNPGHGDIDTSGYNGDPNPHSTVSTWRNFKGKDLHGESLLSVGYGDGGGGMTFEMAESMRELDSLPAIPTTAFSTVRTSMAACGRMWQTNKSRCGAESYTSSYTGEL